MVGRGSRGPTDAQVGERIVALTALALRLDVETAHRADRALADQRRARLAAWIAEQRILPLLSPDEEAVIRDIAPGALDDKIAFSLSWRTQALSALLWAAQRLPALGPYHQPMLAAQLGPCMPVLAPIAPFVASCRLRPRGEIERERTRAELWHWRARTQTLFAQGFQPPAGDSFPAVVRRAAQSALASGLLERITADDFDCGGVAYHDKADWPNAASTAIERHYALNWLCDGGPWDAVRTDT